MAQIAQATVRSESNTKRSGCLKKSLFHFNGVSLTNTLHMFSRILFLFVACLATAHAAASPVGTWSDGKAFSMTFSKSGAATSTISAHGTQVRMEGKWEIIQKGKWAGTLNFVGKVASFIRNGKDVTPATSEISILLDIDQSGSKLHYVMGGTCHDKDGGWCDVTGVAGDGTGDSPVLVRQK